MKQMFVLLVPVFFIVACQVDSGSPEPVPVESPRIESASPITEVKLPFDNPFPNRRNASNNGTPFEPCVAFSDDDLARFGVDPGGIEDAAQVDGQGIRGCAWFMPGEFSLGVVVTNAESLAGYRSGKPELDWKPDFFVGGRAVGLAKLHADESTCMTYVQSGDSIVVTDVVVVFDEARSKFNPCQIAVDFTTANIEKIPG